MLFNVEKTRCGIPTKADKTAVAEALSQSYQAFARATSLNCAIKIRRIPSINNVARALVHGAHVTLICELCSYFNECNLFAYWLRTCGRIGLNDGTLPDGMPLN